MQLVSPQTAEIPGGSLRSTPGTRRPRQVNLKLLTLIILASLGMPAIANGADDRPNVVLIVADDMAHTDLGVAGHPFLKTPNLDRLAEGGVRFTHAFTPNPICTPSRAAILTGQDCFTNDCYYFGMPIKKTSPQLGQLLSDAGYETFYTGKWHNDGRPSERGFSSGANVYVGGMYRLEDGGQTHPRVTDFGGGNKWQVEKFSTTLFTDAAVSFLDGRDKADRPFLMYVSYTTPHDPWTPPGQFRNVYPPEKIPLPNNFMPRPPFEWFTDWHGQSLRDEVEMPYPRTPEGVRDVRSRYLGTIAHLDQQVGRVLKKLEEKQLAENTMVIFLADHGISLGAHGISGKQTLYEEGIRLPLIVRHPRLKRGSATRSELVSLIDVAPTICDVAGVELPTTFEGKSLLPLYFGEDGGWNRDRMFTAFDSPTKHRWIIRSVRTHRHKFIHHLTTDEVELYDLEADPYELKNLAGDPGAADLQKQLTAELADWRNRVEPPEIRSRK